MYSNHRLLKSVIYPLLRSHQVSILDGSAKIWPRSSFISPHIFLKPPLLRLQILTGGVWMMTASGIFLISTSFSCEVWLSTYQSYHKFMCLIARPLELSTPMPMAAHTHLWVPMCSPLLCRHFAHRASFPCGPWNTQIRLPGWQLYPYVRELIFFNITTNIILNCK